MLVLKRKEGQWIEIAHKSGDKLRIRVYNIRSRFPGQLDLAFDDGSRNFEVQRPERPRALAGEPALPMAGDDCWPRRETESPAP